APPELIPHGVNVVATGSDAGAAPQVNVYNADTKALLFSLTPFDPNFTGGVRIAVGDVNGDGTPDIICAAGPGGGPNVVVVSG
ncbi:FG-GAP repeat protein, partial [Klebsiella pneumoniae]|uniref:FG-GAP repeat protein n=1 Tax=Klebsiella pneumoniae TaxID=573 RepID=UPI003F51BCA3